MSASSEKPSERKEVTLEKRFYSSSHILRYLYFLFKIPIGVCYSPCWWRE